MTSVFAPAKLPGSQRNELRRLARNHPDFPRWRAINDPENVMLVPNIIKAINELGLVSEAEKIISAPQTAAPDISWTTHTLNRYGIRRCRRNGHGGGGLARTKTRRSSGTSNSVLSPIKPFLAKPLLDAVESALRPIVIAAHKAPTVITQAAPVVLAQGEAPHAKRIGQTTMAKAFMVGGARGKKP